MNASRGSPALLTALMWTSGILLLILGGLIGLFFYSFDTQYAPGYSEKKFKSIKLGDSEQLVRSLVGQPFSTESTKPYVKWIYSAEDQAGFSHAGEGSGTYTTIQFDDSARVVLINGMIQASANSFTFGDGLNYLKLTEAQIKKLTGSSQAEIKKLFGPPVATYEDTTSKFLCYSKSPSSANYHLRAIGIDKDGKVVKIWREIYWD